MSFALKENSASGLCFPGTYQLPIRICKFAWRGFFVLSSVDEEAVEGPAGGASKKKKKKKKKPAENKGEES